MVSWFRAHFRKLSWSCGLVQTRSVPDDFAGSSISDKQFCLARIWREMPNRVETWSAATSLVRPQSHEYFLLDPPANIYAECKVCSSERFVHSRRGPALHICVSGSDCTFYLQPHWWPSLVFLPDPLHQLQSLLTSVTGSQLLYCD